MFPVFILWERGKIKQQIINTKNMLIEFYGRECPHCIAIKPSLEKLQKEEAVKIESYEVWHDEKNAGLMDTYDKNLCGGVPFLYNTETKGFVCGEDSYENIKKWAGIKK